MFEYFENTMEICRIRDDFQSEFFIQKKNKITQNTRLRLGKVVRERLVTPQFGG